MPVIGIDQVPRELVRPKWYSDLGYGYGNFQRETFDRLLSALLSQGMGGGFGQVPTTPTPQNPGTFNFPSGSQSPLEAAQIQQMGGVPTRGQPFLSKSTQVPGAGVTFTQPTRWGMLPNLERQQTQADIEYKQAQTKSLTPEFQAEQQRRLLGLFPTGTQPPTPDNEFLRGLSDLSTKAQAGDEDAVNRIRMIRRLMQGS